jgi:hypothetical protein
MIYIDNLYPLPPACFQENWLNMLISKALTIKRLTLNKGGYTMETKNTEKEKKQKNPTAKAPKWAKSGSKPGLKSMPIPKHHRAGPKKV